VQIRFTGVFLAGIALAAVTVGAASAQSHQPARLTASAAGAQRPTDISSAAKKKAEKADKKTANKPEADQLTRPEFTAADQAAAQIPGMADVRFWADSVSDFNKALPPQEGAWLILSTGGEEGAYGAGFLNGWSASGTRPDFTVITGVSTGALMATYVFAGPTFNDELRDNYTKISASDIFEVATTPESLTDAWPLAQLVNKKVTPELLSAVASEHAKGRRLFVLTTNMDAGRPMVWNMGAIATHGGDAGLKLFRQVLLASAAIEGMFPPVYITAEANGHQFQEMHADGGATGPLFFGPYLAPNAGQQIPATALYVIVNGKMSTEFYMPSRNTAAILGRAIGLALKAGGRLQLALASLAAKRAGIAFNVTYVGDSFDQVGRGLFDPKYMNALYDYGFAQGREDNRFHNPLSVSAAARPTASEAPAEPTAK
jgi:predicted acylesterase/phospholipase RssA